MTKDSLTIGAQFQHKNPWHDDSMISHGFYTGDSLVTHWCQPCGPNCLDPSCSKPSGLAPGFLAARARRGGQTVVVKTTWNSSTVDRKDKASSASTVVKFRHVEFFGMPSVEEICKPRHFDLFQDQSLKRGTLSRHSP